MADDRRRTARRALLPLALLLAACQPTAEAPSAPPKLTFAQTVHDFGRVAQGTPVEYRFPFVNDGGADLTIINLRAACDCEATLEGGPEVAPRAAGAVRGRFDTDAVYGSQRRTITVYSNDPTQHAVMLTLSGEVVLDVAADPPQVYLGVVPPNVPLLREVALRSGSETLRIGTPHSEAAQLTLQLAAAAPHSGAAAILAIGTAPAAQSGPFSGVVQIPTTSPQHPVLRITVSGIIDPAAPTPRPPGAVVPEGSGTGTEGSGPGVQ